MSKNEKILNELEGFRAFHKEGLKRAIILIGLVKGRVSTHPTNRPKKKPGDVVRMRNDRVNKKAAAVN